MEDIKEVPDSKKLSTIVSIISMCIAILVVLLSPLVGGVADLDKKIENHMSKDGHEQMLQNYQQLKEQISSIKEANTIAHDRFIGRIDGLYSEMVRNGAIDIDVHGRLQTEVNFLEKRISILEKKLGQ